MDKKLRILHVHSQAGVSGILAKYMRKRGHTVDIIKRAGQTSFGIDHFYGFKEDAGAGGRYGYRYLARLAKESRQYDVIHVHDTYEAVPLIRLLGFKRKIILHYHGSTIQNTPPHKRFIAEKAANAVLASTQNLLECACAKAAIFLPNPVDTDHFPKNSWSSGNGRALCYVKLWGTKDEMRKYLGDDMGPIDFVHVSDRSIEYEDMPKLLCSYSKFIDVFLYKGRLLHVNSTAGLQAMQMGVPTLSHDFEWHTRLPAAHEPEAVCDRLLGIYRGADRP